MKPAIEVNNLSVAYGQHLALTNFSAHFPAGLLSAVVGPNGAGKSTLIKAILGLVPAFAGQVSLLGQDPKISRRQVAYVPQRSDLDWDFPATVLEVALMGSYRSLGWFRRPGKAQKERAHAALAQVGMAELVHRPIGQLSGGQQQRVLLARALVQEAEIYILDEPFQGVDAPTERAIVSVLRGLKAAGKSVIAVHHDLYTVPSYFDYVVMVNRELVAEGPVASAFTPENLKQAYGLAEVLA